MARKKGAFEKISSKARRLGQQMKKRRDKGCPWCQNKWLTGCKLSGGRS